MLRKNPSTSSSGLLGRSVISMLVAGASSLASFTVSAQTETCFDYTGSIETWVVPAGVTTVSARAWGAQGGDSTWSTPRTGGLGAFVSGDISVTPGESLSILVGGQGESLAVGGGGGGSFLVSGANLPLLVAGGGGGASSDNDGVGGTTSADGTADSQNTAAGGTGGNGGDVCASGDNNGGGGGGFLTDGATANSGAPSNGGFGGTSFANGGTIVPGGRLDNACDNDPAGGFGGGGSATCNTVGGGGGGGYSGGAGGAHLNNCGTTVRAGGGGGGSFNSGANQVNTPAERSGNGQVCLTAPDQPPPGPIPSDAVPVPTLPLYGLVLTGVGVLVLASRRLRKRDKQL